MAFSQSKFRKNVQADDVRLAGAAIAVAQHLKSSGHLALSQDVVKTLVSNESFSTAQVETAGSVLDGIVESCEGFVTNNKSLFEGTTPAARQAMVNAMISAQNPRASLLRSADNQSYASSTGPFDKFIPHLAGIDAAKIPQATVEAYDTKPNEETLKFTAAFALTTATQNKTGELFFPTINLAPDEYAVSVEIPLLGIFPTFNYEPGQGLKEFPRRNAVGAEIDHTILRDDSLDFTPVRRSSTADLFVDSALITPYDYTNEAGETFKTSSLAIGVRATLFTVMQTDAELAKGELDQTDALDTGAELEFVDMLFTSADGNTKEVVRIPTLGLPGAQLVTSSQGLTRRMDLQFTTDDVQIDANTKLLSGADSTLLTAFAGDTAHTAWLSFSVRGDINLQDTSYEFTTGNVVAKAIRTSADVNLDPTDPTNASIFAIFSRAKVIGFKLKARRVNSNLRTLGKLVDFNTYRQTYGVRLLSPLTIQRPITNGDSQDALHAAALSYLCKVRQSNDAITTLLEERNVIRGFKRRSDVIGRQPEILGVSSWLVEPCLIEAEINLPEDVQSIEQHDRYIDVQSILTDTVKLVSYKMWQQSRWQAAANLLEGMEAPLPRVGFTVDQKHAQYINIVGDTRTVGPDFEYDKAINMDDRMYNQIAICFNYASAQPGVPHPLNHGMMLNKPETVAALNLSRTSHSRELIVHPSYRHVWLTPVLGWINVIGLDEVMTKKTTTNVEVTNPEDFPVADGGGTDPDNP